MALTKVTYVDNVTVIGATNLNAIQDEIIANGTAVVNLSNGKVDKVVGKGLSTNDFSDEAALKLSNIEAGATHVEVDDELSTSSTNAIQNKAVAVELNKKISTGGAYEDLTAGNAMQIVSGAVDVDQVPYAFRKTGGNLTVGKREYDKLVGGTVVWNQLISPNAGSTTTVADVTVTNNGDGTLTVNGTANAQNSYNLVSFTGIEHVFFLAGMSSSKPSGSYAGINGASIDTGSGGIIKRTSTTQINIRLDFANGTVFTNYVWKPVFIDLTMMFGSTIADYIYGLETANAGAGVAYFKSLFPKSYYAYNAGTLMSVNAASHETVGFNQWDEVAEGGAVDAQTGEPITPTGTTSRIRSKNFIPCFPSTTYYTAFVGVYQNGSWYSLFFYDKDKKYLSSVSPNKNNTFVTPQNAYYMKFNTSDGWGGTAYSGGICINISDPAKNGTYEPYTKHIYPLDSTLTLRGIPKLDSNNKLYYDGDTYASDGTVTRKYGVVDLGTLTWSYIDISGNERFVTSSLASVIKKPASNATTANIISKYLATGASYYTSGDKTIAVYADGDVGLRDTSYTTKDSFVSAMSGVYLIYELATPTTESAEPFQNPQICDPNGTEEYVDAGVTASTPTRDVSIPVGHETEYPVDLVAKIEGLPSDFSTLIAPTEKTTTASKGYSVNELLIMNNQLYKVTSNISNGGTITVGTNVTATTIGAILTQLLNA